MPDAATPEPMPTPNTEPHIIIRGHEILDQRDATGLATYGVHLQPFNGRDFERDAIEEAADWFLYQIGAQIERRREMDALTARLAEVERQLAEVHGKYPSLMPDECLAERAAIAGEYIAAGQPPQKVNFMYAQAIRARRRIAEVEQQRDSALALAKEAVEVLEQVQAHCKPADIFWDKLPLVDRKRVDTFLARPEVKEMKGGE